MMTGSDGDRLHPQHPSQHAAGHKALPPHLPGPPHAQRALIPLHRISAVRKQQGVSLRTAARHLGKEVGRVKVQEEESSDLRISDLRKWQKLLDVPLADLLVDPGPSLSRPVLERAKMLRIMKTVATIRERATVPAMQRLAQMLYEQLIDLMPEFKEVAPWHSVGQRRGLDEYGRVVERRLSEDSLFRLPND